MTFQPGEKLYYHERYFDLRKDHIVTYVREYNDTSSVVRFDHDGQERPVMTEWLDHEQRYPTDRITVAPS